MLFSSHSLDLVSSEELKILVPVGVAELLQ